jgi:hypothetical protein
LRGSRRKTKLSPSHRGQALATRTDFGHFFSLGLARSLATLRVVLAGKTCRPHFNVKLLFCLAAPAATSQCRFEACHFRGGEAAALAATVVRGDPPHGKFVKLNRSGTVAVDRLHSGSHLTLVEDFTNFKTQRLELACVDRT